MATELAMNVLQIRLLLALGLRRSQHVRVMRGTTVTLHQGHALHARLAGTRVKRLRMVPRLQCAMRVQRTRLQLALGLRRSRHVRVMRGTTVTLHQGHALHARLGFSRQVLETMRVNPAHRSKPVAVISKVAWKILQDSRLLSHPKQSKW